MVKEFLSQKGVDFREVDVSVDQAAAQELVEKTGRTAVPVTVIDDQVVVGFDRTQLEQIISLAQMQENKRPPFGVSVADAGKDRGTVPGAYVGKVSPGLAAERLGLEPGDVITELNGQGIANADDLEAALSKLDRGSSITVTFVRGENTINADGAL